MSDGGIQARNWRSEPYRQSLLRQGTLSDVPIRVRCPYVQLHKEPRGLGHRTFRRSSGPRYRKSATPRIHWARAHAKWRPSETYSRVVHQTENAARDDRKQRCLVLPRTLRDPFFSVVETLAEYPRSDLRTSLHFPRRCQIASHLDIETV